MRVFLHESHFSIYILNTSARTFATSKSRIIRRNAVSPLLESFLYHFPFKLILVFVPRHHFLSCLVTNIFAEVVSVELHVHSHNLIMRQPDPLCIGKELFL